MNIKTRALALAFGFTWALFVLLTGWAATFLNWGVDLVNVVSSAYLGFAPTFTGSIIGAIWGFFDGLIFGTLIGYFYNRFS